MMADSRYQWRLAAWLAERGMETFALDFRGHGESRPPTLADGWRFGDYVEQDLPAALVWTRARAGRPLVVVGHSLGGLVACAVAPVRAEDVVSRVVLVAATVWRRDEAVGGRRLYEEGVMGALSLLARLGRPMRGRRWGLGTADEPASWPSDLSRWFRTSRWEFDETMARMDVPVTALCGDEDRFCPAGSARRFLARAGSGEKRFVVMPGVDHFGFYRTDAGRAAWGELV